MVQTEIADLQSADVDIFSRLDAVEAELLDIKDLIAQLTDTLNAFDDDDGGAAAKPQSGANRIGSATVAAQQSTVEFMQFVIGVIGVVVCSVICFFSVAVCGLWMKVRAVEGKRKGSGSAPVVTYRLAGNDNENDNENDV